MYLSFYLCLNRAPDLHGPTESERKKGKSLSRVRLFAIAWTVVYQAPPSMGFSRQEYWSGLQFPSPGDLPDSGIKPRYPALQADALPSEPPGKPMEAYTDALKTKQINLSKTLNIYQLKLVFCGRLKES